MDKEYMLFSVRRRKEELLKRYRLACRGRDKHNNLLKRGTAESLRGRIKKDLQLLALIEELLIGCKSMFIEDYDAIDGFHKLVEPCERFG